MSEKIEGNQFTIIKSPNATWVKVHMNNEFDINRYFNADLIKYIECGKKMPEALYYQQDNEEYRKRLKQMPTQIKAGLERNYDDIPNVIKIVVKPSWELSFSYEKDKVNEYKSDLKLLKEIVGLEDY